MKRIVRIGAFSALLGVPLAAQTIAPREQTGARQIDIGAETAPLADAQRTALDAAVRAHNYAAERKTLDQAIQDHPDSWELPALEGRLAYLERKPKDAVEDLERANRMKPLAESDRLTLALAYQFSGRLEEAQASLAALAKASPADARYPYLLGRIEESMRRQDDAERHFREALRLDSQLLRAWDDLGDLYQVRGETDKARDAYKAAVEANRTAKHGTEWPPLQMGIFLLGQDDLEGGEKLLLEALHYNPRSALAHFQIGELRRKQGKPDEALAEFKEAVVDNPKLAEAWFGVGRELERRGNTIQAKRAFDIFRQLQKEQQPATTK